jgi:hypothetical protein
MLTNLKEGDSKIGITENNVQMSYCDPSGSSASDKGISSVDFLETNGIKLSYRNSSILAGIELVREKLMDASGKIFLKVSRNCRRVISDFRHYSKKHNSEEPQKDNVSDHTMDAVRYFIINHFSNYNWGNIIPPKVVGVNKNENF